MQPIRSEQSQEVGYDPWARQQQELGETDLVHVVSDAGGVESYRTARRFACHCGCFQPPGGCCAECRGAVVCVACFGHCQQSGCGKPICLRHSLFVDRPGGLRLRLCESCHAALTRKQRLRTLGRLLLAPFVQFEE